MANFDQPFRKNFTNRKLRPTNRLKTLPQKFPNPLIIYNKLYKEKFLDNIKVKILMVSTLSKTI